MRRYGKRIMHSFVNDINLRTKLFWIFFTLIVLPLGAFITFTFINVSGTIRSQTFAAAQKGFDSMADTTQKAMVQLDNVLDILTGDPIIYRVAAGPGVDGSFLSQMEDAGRMSISFSNLIKLSDVNGIRLYVGSGAAFARENRYVYLQDEQTQFEWYKKLMKSAGQETWFSPQDYADLPENQQQYFSSMRVIYDPSSITVPIAILRADISVQKLEKAFYSAPITENSMYVLMDNNGALMYSGAWDKEPDTAMLQELRGISTNQWCKVKKDNQNVYAQVRTIGNASWQVAVLIPENDTFAVSSKLCTEMLVLALAVAIVALIIATIISHSTVSRIRALSATMARVESGELSTQLKAVGNDEIGRLMQSFTSMMTRLELLLDEQYTFGKRIKSLELKALQAQINPHFLYNSLDLINCMAIKRNVPEITSMVNALSRFYKLSLSHGKDVISIHDELMHAELYIRIQNMRFEESICVTWDINDQIRNCEIIKILLQPIIENAIIHGIFEKDEKAGELVIKGWQENDDIYISVTDNGVGMPQQEIDRFFVLDSVHDTTEDADMAIEKRKGGYGVRNIHERIKLAYGNEYGLSCQSTIGKGTCVTIHIPCKTSEKKE